MSDSLYVLGIDLEGMNRDLVESGIDLKVDRIIEIGAVLWDTSRKQPVQIISELIDEADRLPISPEVFEITGIDDSMLKNWGQKNQEINQTLNKLEKLMIRADYIMAHNAKQYDLPMLGALFKRQGLKMPEKVWIDTMTDIEFPSMIQQRSLAILEHSHGFINPFPHRAVTDVLSMLKIASNYSVARMGKLAKSPICTIVAKLNAPDWRNHDEVAKFNKIKNKISRAKFKWDPQQKIWSKEIHSVLLEENKIHFDFEWYQKS